MKPDPLIQDVREARREISHECGHDLWRLYARYEEMQRQLKAEGKCRFVTQPLVGSGLDATMTTPK